MKIIENCHQKGLALWYAKINILLVALPSQIEQSIWRKSWNEDLDQIGCFFLCLVGRSRDGRIIYFEWRQTLTCWNWRMMKQSCYMVDSKRLQFTAAVEISYLDKIIQGWSCEYIHESGNVNQKQISLLRQAVMDGEISQSQMIDILNGSTIGRPVQRWNRWLRNYWANGRTVNLSTEKIFKGKKY